MMALLKDSELQPIAEGMDRGARTACDLRVIPMSAVVHAE